MARRKKVSNEEVVKTIYDSIQASPKKQRRLKSRTFWEMFRYQRRSTERIAEIEALLNKRNITVIVSDGELGNEDLDDWLILTVIEHPHPPGLSSSTIVGRDVLDNPMPESLVNLPETDLESEHEVEVNFALPLLQALGYSNDDIAMGMAVEMWQGVRRTVARADIVVYDGAGRSQSESLIVVEAKDKKLQLTRDHVAQARSYAMWLRCPYYIITNGIDVEVWLFRGEVVKDVQLLKFERTELPTVWEDFRATLGRDVVADYKRKREADAG